MSASEGKIGYGSKFGIKNGGGTYVDVAEVYSIGPPGYNRERVDLTHLTSDDEYMEYGAGMKDGGEVTIELNYIPAESDVLEAAFAAESGDFQITAPNGVRLQFRGVVTAYDIQPLNLEKMTATATFKVSGKPLLLAGAAPTNVILPAISGTAQVGVELTALPGEWQNAGAFTYQWQEDDVGWGDISGATSQTYTPVAGNQGNELRVVVTSTNAVGSDSATSAATAATLAA